MKISFTAGFVLLMLLAGCQQQNDNEIVKELKVPMHSPTDNQTQRPSKNTTHILNTDGDTLFVNLKMDSIGQHHNISIKVQSGKTIFGELSSKDSMANIRFTQIQLPDLKFDGPFGRNVRYNIKDTGEYHLIIGQNLMAGDPWKGDFILKAWVK
jgi:small nuclear ribonucleoprotein (snRNP)-like protein